MHSAQLPSVLLHGPGLLEASLSGETVWSSCIAMPDIVIDMAAGMELLPSMLGVAQLGTAPFRNNPSARTNVTIRRVNSLSSIARTIRPGASPFKDRPGR